MDKDETAKLLGLLRRYNLLEFDEIILRYSLHDLLADYALSLMNSGDEQEARIRHATHYKELLSAADDLYLEGGEKILLGLRLFDLEWENIRTAQAWMVSAISVAREIGDRRGEGNALCNLGNAYAALGDARKAIEFYEQRMVIAREIGDRRGEAFGSWNLGLQYERAGEFQKAIDVMQICVDYERGIGHPDAEKDAAKIEELRGRLR